MSCRVWTLCICMTASVHAIAQSSQGWSLVASMKDARYYQASVLLEDGRLLVTGGQASCSRGGCFTLTSAEVYDPATGDWTATGDMITARSNHFAVRLSNGKVLVGGGIPPVKDTELYDPVAGLWTRTGSMIQARSNATATVLRNGKVLVTGGADPCCSPYAGVRSAELYDPDTGMWAPTVPMSTTRNMHTATLLADGRVLIVAGGDFGDLVANLRSSAEIYNPDSGTWANTGRLKTARAFHKANLLPNGKVLVTGGTNLTASTFADTAELYDPETGEWTNTPPARTARVGHTATSLSDGRVVVVGGFGNGAGNPALRTAEIYDSGSGTWAAVEDMTLTRGHHAATMLTSGKLLVTGGSGTDSIGITAAEMFEVALPSVATISAAASAPLGIVATESIASAYGSDFASETQLALTASLPTTLAGVGIRVLDKTGSWRAAPLFVVTPSQINFQMPPGTPPGFASVVVFRGNQAIASGAVRVQLVEPGLFTANGSGKGAASGSVLRIRADGSRSVEPLALYDPDQKRFTIAPIDFGPETDQLFLTLYGTGIRKAGKVKMSAEDTELDVLFAGDSPEWIGLDQVNARLPRSLAGRGAVDLLLTADGILSNVVQISFR